MKRLALILLGVVLTLNAYSQGWPANFKGVMLQGFYWNSYVDSQWSNLEKQSDELSKFFALVWVPQSGDCHETNNVMGYGPMYWFTHNSSFGTEEQLRSMIKTFKSKGVGVIEDVVINHRNNIGNDGSWVDFPAETYKGVKYQLLPTDICKNDDGGKTLTWATSKGIKISSTNDEGEDWDGMRDLDHTSANVQNNVKAYLKFLLSDLGYTGFRYDMTKGYAAYYTGMYNATVNPTYSVGEYWDGNVNVLKTWLEDTKRYNGTIQSATFDFAIRYSVRDAVNATNQWQNLGKGGLCNTNSGAYARYAVTFVENHDTENRGPGAEGDPIKQNIAAANAFIIAMPGTPCVFYKHWKEYKQEIKQMILARNIAGITNTSSSSNLRSNSSYYAQRTVGSNASLIAVLGSSTGYVPESSQYTKILSGTNYTYYLERKAETAWASVPDGTYEKAFNVTLTAVSATNGATLVYTTNGSNPTASSSKVASGGSINISNSCTLKVGVLAGGAVKGIITREYTIKAFEPHTATVYVKDPSWDAMYFYAWDVNGTNLNGAWPGKTGIESKTIKGQKFFYQTFDIKASNYTFNIIFNQGSGKPQTTDIGPISEDVYYEISGKDAAGKFFVKDITADYKQGDGVEDLRVDNTKQQSGPAMVYSIDGRFVKKAADAKSAREGLAPGIYIINREKVIVR